MNRFSEIADNIEHEYDSSFDMDKSRTAPRVSFIDYWLLELCRLLDARLAALEAPKPNERDWEAAANSALAQLTFARKNADWLRDTLDKAQDEVSQLKAGAVVADDMYAALQERYSNLLNSPMPTVSDAWRNVNASLTAEVKRERERNAALVAEVARLNTFLAQQADPHKAILAEALKERTAEVKRLESDNANLAAGKSYWLNGSGTLLRRLNALEAQRNALAAQVDDLRNVNAGLRKHNASQQDLLVSGRLRSLRRIEAILAVEWVTGECPWCGNSHREGHEEDCQRQAALR